MRGFCGAFEDFIFKSDRVVLFHEFAAGFDVLGVPADVVNIVEI